MSNLALDVSMSQPHHVNELTDLVDGVIYGADITRIGSSARRYYD